MDLNNDDYFTNTISRVFDIIINTEKTGKIYNSTFIFNGMVFASVLKNGGENSMLITRELQDRERKLLLLVNMYKITSPKDLVLFKHKKIADFHPKRDNNFICTVFHNSK